MAGITNTASLKTAIGEYMLGSGATLASSYDIFIQNCEAALNYGVGEPYRMAPLRTAAMETAGTLTLDANGEATLPTDYLEWRFAISTTSSAVAAIEPMTPGQITDRYSTTAGGIPGDFTITGSKVRVRPTASSISFVYYAKIPALTDAATTNWLITAAPNVYLYGSVLQAAIFQDDATRIGQFTPLFVSAVGGLNSSDKGARWGRSVARVRGPTP
jgi:hypothetical protein